VGASAQGLSRRPGCRFCIDINSATLLKRGVPPAKVEALTDWRRSIFFTDEERVALDYAEAVTVGCDRRRVDGAAEGSIR